MENQQIVDTKRAKKKDTRLAETTGTSILSNTSSRGRRKVLKEEEYLSALGTILRRDFFPTLDRLEAQYEYLSALERSDVDGLRWAASKLDFLTANGQFGPLDDGSSREEEREAAGLSLDEFQARYVTEDTADFEDLLQQFNLARQKRYWKVFGNRFGRPNLPSTSVTSTTGISSGTISGRSLLLEGNLSDANNKTLVESSNTSAISTTTGGIVRGGITQPHRTRFELEDEDEREDGDDIGDKEEKEKDNDDDLYFHYKAMLREHGLQKVSPPTTNVSSLSHYSQKEYDFVDTPLLHNNHDDGNIPPTPSRFIIPSRPKTFNPRINSISHQKTALLRSPAIRRFLRAQTPRRNDNNHSNANNSDDANRYSGNKR